MLRLGPRCFKSFTTASDLAAHLHEAHGIHAMAAIAEARGPAEPPPPIPAPAAKPHAGTTTTEETTMPKGTQGTTMSTWTCKACDEKGHTARFCPKKRATPATNAAPPDRLCGYCRRSKGDHSATCPRRQGAKTTMAKAAKGTALRRVPEPAARPQAVTLGNTDAMFRAASEVIQVLAPLSQEQRGRALKAAEMLLPLA